MTALAAEIARRDGEVVAGPSGAATAAELAGAGPSGALGPADRVALLVDDPVVLVRLLAALDGRVGGLLLLSHALDDAAALALMRAAEATAAISDRPLAEAGLPVLAPAEAIATAPDGPGDAPTRWLMTTSGTTGLPKIVPHDLKSLSRSVYRFGAGDPPVWGLLYDPTRFAGLQVVLQALLGGGRLVAADTSRPLGDQVAALAAAGVTHLSATPTLWRRILMAPGREALALRQVTLGGEIAGQETLDALKAAFPQARVSHIYASTEAGVGFSVTDGRAGFPESYLATAPGGVRLRIVEGLLHVRPPGGGAAAPGIEVDADGYVNSGDRVDLAEGRVRFLGRDSGVINIGGVKVHPESVEAVIAAVDGVALVQVSAKKSPLTGALVVAEVALAPGAEAETVKAAIREACRARLPREATPATIRIVDEFRTNAAGKLVRAKGVSP